MEKLFSGKVALVTGAASGIGQSAAFSYAAGGYYPIDGRYLIH